MEYLNHCMERGKYAWSAWLPVVAACGFIIQVGANIGGGSLRILPWLSLNGVISSFELIVLFVISPIFFTRYANILAVAALLYLAERFAFSGSSAPNLAFMFLMGEVTVLAILADRMPWHQLSFRSHSQKRLREVLLQILVVYGLISCLYTILHLKLWQNWVYKQFGLGLNQVEAFSVAIFIVGLWLMISLNVFRSSALMLVTIPSLVMIAFMNGLPTDLLVVPLVMALALSLAQTRRRYLLAHD